MPEPISQRQIAHALLTARGIARLVELRDAGVTAATMSRMERNGEVLRLARGLYQLSDAPLDANHSLVPVHKRLFFRVLEVFCSLKRSLFARRDGTGL
ncbi:type IV toxin-antitoxin system AbiEi family antitoxin domain-containing protein, partial [Sinorhizobium meliloti]|uniref:type IV toxin-antitoxin system AbiEi family antitoxin domain-containing protein n=1 Tax=Rhizobium meliloti TaxID=382 RepID=UPI001F2DCE9B